MSGNRDKHPGQDFDYREEIFTTLENALNDIEQIQGCITLSVAKDRDGNEVRLTGFWKSRKPEPTPRDKIAHEFFNYAMPVSEEKRKKAVLGEIIEHAIDEARKSTKARGVCIKTPVLKELIKERLGV